MNSRSPDAALPAAVGGAGRYGPVLGSWRLHLFWAEMHEVLTEPGRPFVIDCSETEKMLGVSAHPGGLRAGVHHLGSHPGELGDRTARAS